MNQQSDVTFTQNRTRSRDIADELKTVMRLAVRDPESLAGELPALSALHGVAAAGELDEPARVHFILHRLIPEYLRRLPAGRDGRAIRELLTWEEEDGQPRSLTTRYHKAAAHLVNAAHDFGRRQEPRLLLECARRFIAFDHEDRLVPCADRVTPAAALQASMPPPADDRDPLGGIVRVHRNLDLYGLADRMAGADEIVILNTWIPGIDILADALVDALSSGTYVSILLLNPSSTIAQFRSHALQSSPSGRAAEDRVRPGARHCLDVLAAVSSTVDDDVRRHLRVRLYNSLPSISVYGIDERAFVSFFLHGQLAVKSAQIEVLDQDSLMGRLVFGELQTLWNNALEIKDITRWQSETQLMQRRLALLSHDSASDVGYGVQTSSG